MGDDNVSMEDFKAAFGITSDPNPPADPQDGADDGQGAQGTEGNDGVDPTKGGEGAEGTQGTEGADDSKQKGEEGNKSSQKTSGVDKAAQTAETFARMRVTNTKYENILKGVASVLGVKDVDLNNIDVLADTLNTKVTEALAKQQGIPPELLQKVADLEKTQEMYQKNDIKNSALLGFQKVKDDFTLTDEELQTFAEELVTAGKNPFVTKLDLVSEYKLAHFDEIVAKASQKAVQTEAQRAAKALEHGSNPGSKQGASTSDTDPKKITSVKDLNAWFDEHAKGN